MRTKVFLDTNIIMDLLVSERSSMEANTILSAVKTHCLEAQISTQSIFDAYYSSLKYNVPHEQFYAFVKELRKYVNFAFLDSSDLDWALQHFSGDLEDDAQFSCAYEGCCDFFITRDKKQLVRENNTPMKIISPGDFVKHLI